MSFLYFLHNRNTILKNRLPTGFTLIELLVVIAIIAMLAAILFPVFASARDKARAATCQSNLRQMFLAFEMYCSDYHDKYPPVFQWKSRIQPYINNIAINTCPSRPHLPWFYGQGYNIGCADPFVQGFLEQPRARVTNPSDKILIAEWDRCNTGPPCGPQGLFSGGATSWWAVSRIHGGGSNVVFGDGHVRWLRPEVYHSTTEHINNEGYPAPADASPVPEEVWRKYWDINYGG